MENNVAIRFEHVNKSYGNREILKDFNLEIRKGEFLTIIGNSGFGKTTVLKLINGLISPTFGVIYVDGKDISKENQTLLRRNIGYIIQGIGLFPHMTIRKNIAYVPSLLNHRNKERTRKAVKQLIDVVGLDRDMLDRYPVELSGGQRQRVDIARALATNPDILLMDEPFAALDAITREQMQLLLVTLHARIGMGIILVTHDVEEALLLGDEVCVMAPGQGIVASRRVEVPRTGDVTDRKLLRELKTILRQSMAGQGGPLLLS